MVALRDLWRDAAREALVHGLFFLPEERRVRLDRRLRGREELRRLRLADAVVVSYGKSGRTWLRVMLSRFYQQRFGLPEKPMLEFDNLHRADPRVPRILFSHNNYIRDVTDSFDNRRPFYDRRVVLLVRDPRDVAVSQYFQWKHRMRPWKKRINGYPAHGTEVSPFSFVMNPAIGMPAIIDFMEVWERELERCNAALLVRYEDLRADTGRELGRLLEFLGAPASPEEIQDAVRFSSLENMRKLEGEGKLGFLGRRGRPGDKGDPQSFKTRRGKVGGWTDYFTPEEARVIETCLRERPVLGYGGAGLTRPASP